MGDFPLKVWLERIAQFVDHVRGNLVVRLGGTGGITRISVQDATRTERAWVDDSGAASFASVQGVQYADVQGKPTTFPPSAHTHPGTDITSPVANAANAAFATEAQLAFNAEFASYADAANTAINADNAANADTVDGFHAAQFADAVHSHVWSDITNPPSTYPPSAHAASHHAGGSDPLTLGSIAGALTDAQHGARGGGSLHALATSASAGFMAPSDKQKLDSQKPVIGTGAVTLQLTHAQGDYLYYNAPVSIPTQPDTNYMVIMTPYGAPGEPWYDNKTTTGFEVWAKVDTRLTDQAVTPTIEWKAERL